MRCQYCDGLRFCLCPGGSEEMVTLEPLPLPQEVDLPVKGRGRLTAQLQMADGRVIVRLDDQSRPDWWAEVHLDGAALVLLQEYVDALPVDEE